MTYVALLLAVALVSGVLAANATLVSQAQRREREKQLLWVGDQMRRALLDYARAGGGRFPDRLEDLLEDPRSPARRRYLRQIYVDPMTRGTDWGLIRSPDGRIVGVHSRSTAVPLKSAGFADPYIDFGDAKSYADWKFAAPVAKRPEPDKPGADPAVRPLPPGPQAPASTPASPAATPQPADDAQPPAGDEGS